MSTFNPSPESLATFKPSPERATLENDPNFWVNRENVLGLAADMQAEAARLQAFAKDPSKDSEIAPGPCCVLSCCIKS